MENFVVVGFMSEVREIELKNNPFHIHLLSGGLDSAYSIFKKAKEMNERGEQSVIHPVFFNYGHFSAKIEEMKVNDIIRYIRKFLKNEFIIDDPIKISLNSDLFKWCENDAFLGNHGKKEQEIENRNMVLFSVLASYLIACADHQNIESPTFEITSGFKEKELGDCSKKFFEQVKKLLKIYRPKFTFNFDILKKMPYPKIVNKIKYSLLNGDEDEVQLFRSFTISCFSPNDDGTACNQCSKCTSIEGEKKLKKMF